MKKILLWFLIITLSLGNAKGDNLDSILLSKVEVLEQNEQLEAREHQLNIKELKFEVQKTLEEKKNTLFWWFVGIIGTGTIIGMVTSFFWLPTIIKNRVEKEVEEQIVEAMKGRSNLIRKMLRNYREEEHLLKKKKIYFYKNQDGTDIKDFLILFGFTEKSFVLDASTADVVFINNEDNYLGKLDLRGKTESDITTLLIENQGWLEIKKIIGLHSNKCFFYYNSKGVQFPSQMFTKLETLARVNYATNPAQLYGNLLNSLKYQDLLV